MRKLLAFPLLFLVLMGVGCDNPTGNERRSLVGLWTSSGFAPATVQMTLTEVARTVEGAGSWVDPASATAFAVSGAHAEETVSLLFVFKDLPSVNFLGEFVDEDVMEGVLTGGPFRATPIRFEREEED